MGAKILVVEDDDYFRQAVVDLLKKRKFEVLEAPNGKSAREILTVQEPDLVLSDIQMPGLTGLELLEWSKANKPVPFVIMTGFSMILETRSAFELGAKGFIAKPFKNVELLEVLDGVIRGGAKPEAAGPEKSDHLYCKVSIEEFVTRPRIDFDVYIRLSDHKYIKIAHKGDEIPRDKVAYYKAKGLRFLHIAREDFSKLVEFNMSLAKVVNRSDVSEAKKLNFIKYTGEAILEKAFVAGVDKQSFNDAQSLLGMTVNAISESDEVVDLLAVLNSHSDDIYAHSLGVALYSIMIARKMGFESNSAFFKLSMAGMFHDIGKKEIDRAILDKSRHLLTSDERKLIESHVVRGHDILTAIQGIPEDVVQMVYEHHEDVAGRGYPTSKAKKDQHPLSRILQTAELFITQTLKSAHGEGKPASAAIAYLEKIYLDRIDPECLAALKSLFSN